MGTNDNPRFDEAIKGEYKQEFLAAYNREIANLEKYHCFEITDLPKGHKEVGSKVICKIKRNEKGEIKDFTGVSAGNGFEVPVKYDFLVKTDDEEIEGLVQLIFDYVEKKVINTLKYEVR